eukprot:113621_1
MKFEINPPPSLKSVMAAPVIKLADSQGPTEEEPVVDDGGAIGDKQGGETEAGELVDEPADGEQSGSDLDAPAKLRARNFSRSPAGGSSRSASPPLRITRSASGSHTPPPRRRSESSERAHEHRSRSTRLSVVPAADRDRKGERLSSRGPPGGEEDRYSVTYKTRLCEFYPDCPNQNRCNFAHGNHELRSATHRNPLYRTAMCRRLPHCRSGSDCQFAHTRDELRRVNAGVPRLYNGPNRSNSNRTLEIRGRERERERVMARARNRERDDHRGRRRASVSSERRGGARSPPRRVGSAAGSRSRSPLGRSRSPRSKSPSKVRSLSPEQKGPKVHVKTEPLSNGDTKKRPSSEVLRYKAPHSESEGEYADERSPPKRQKVIAKKPSKSISPVSADPIVRSLSDEPLDNIRRERDELRSKYSALKSTVADQSTALKQYETTMQQHLKKLKKALSKALKENTVLKNDNQELSSEVGDVKMSLSIKTDEYAQLSAKFRSVTRIVQKQVTECRAAQSQFAQELKSNIGAIADAVTGHS